MAEPPSGWAAPGDEPNEPPAPTGPPGPTGPTVPVATPPPNPGASTWGAPPQYGQQPGWGPPPGPPNSWGGQPAGGQPAGGGQPNPSNQWGGQPTQPNQWGGQPPGGQPQWGPPAPGNWGGRGPGIVPLRPLAIGEIYDGAIRAIRGNPRTMVGFSAIVISLLTLLATAPQAYALTALLNNPLGDPETSDSAEFADLAALISPFGITALVSVLQFIVATTIVSGLLIVAVDGAVRGQSLTPGQLWARCRSRLLAVLGLALVVLIAMPLVLLIGALPGIILLFAVSSPVAGVIVLVIGLLAGVIGCWALYFGFWAVAAPALLLENLGVFAALGRSYRLVRGSFWRVLGIGLLTAVIAYIIRQIFSIPFAIVGGIFLGFQGDDGFVAILIQLLITDIGTVLAGAVLYPFTAGVAALLYLDLRMRREGLDVDLMRS